MGQKKSAKKNVLTTIPETPGAAVPVTRSVSTKAPRKSKSPTITHEQIAQRAHDIWLKQGCHHGQDQDHWLEAEQQLKAELSAK